MPQMDQFDIYVTQGLPTILYHLTPVYTTVASPFHSCEISLLTLVAYHNSKFELLNKVLLCHHQSWLLFLLFHQSLDLEIFYFILTYFK